MSEQFTDLRVHLEHEAVQPDFDQLRIRRSQRTQRYAVGGVALLIVMALLGVGIAINAMRPSAAAPAPGSSQTGGPSVESSTPSATSTSPSSTPSSAPPAADPTLRVLSAANSGSTLVVLTTGCVDSACGHYVWQLRVSNDGAKTWQTRTLSLTAAPESPRVYMTGDGYAWIVIPERGEIVAVPPNGGPEVDLTGLTAVQPSAYPVGSVAGDVLWVGWGQKVFRVAASPTVAAKPVLTAAGPVFTVAASSGTTALVGTEVPDTTQAGGDTAKWSLTSNSGQSFGTVADPCAGTSFAGSFEVTVTFGGSAAWATCTGGPGAGQEPKAMAVGTDLRHWTSRGDVESSGYATNVVAFSTTAAWRYGDRAEIYRTTDGQHWSSVGIPTDGPKAFVAFDIDHAIYLGNEDTDQLFWHSTADGGKTWTKTPYTW